MNDITQNLPNGTVPVTATATATDMGTLVNGSRVWYKVAVDGELVLHRDNDLPAVVYANGTEAWFQDGQLHRGRDLPAIVCANGSKFWCKRGKLHRGHDMPAAIIATDGAPVPLGPQGTWAQAWYWNGELHREGDEPAIIDAWGNKVWYQHGKRHRNKHEPAIVSSAGLPVAWYRHGEEYTPTFEERIRVLMDRLSVRDDDDDDDYNNWDLRLF